MIRLAPSFVRLAAHAAAVAMSAVVLTTCGSSSTSAGSSTSPSTSSSMSTSVSTAPSSGAIDPNIAALCTGLNSADLASLAQAKDPTSAQQAWAKLAADAPARWQPCSQYERRRDHDQHRREQTDRHQCEQ